VSYTIDDEEMIFHALFIGSTGAGKTNAMLFWLRRLFSNRKDVALVLIDPHGDAAVDLVRLIPKPERESHDPRPHLRLLRAEPALAPAGRRGRE